MTDALVTRLLINNDFQIGRVDGILFNLVGLASFQTDQHRLTTSDKQNIYETSRAPLRALNEELKPLEYRLGMIQWNNGTKEFKNLSKKVKKLQEKIKATQLDVSNDVFQQINSHGSMGMVGNDGKMSIDLHALHVDEAKTMLEEYVFPTLAVVKRVIVITGRGSHSKGGKSLLKDEIKVRVASYPIRSLYAHETIFALILKGTRAL
jgi:DNA-nicking Smr family endonuclease